MGKGLFRAKNKTLKTSIYKESKKILELSVTKK
jgi:hypothetical protein